MIITFTSARDLRESIRRLSPSEYDSALVFDDIMTNIKKMNIPNNVPSVKIAALFPMKVEALMVVPSDCNELKQSMTPIANFVRSGEHKEAFIFEGISR